MLSSVRWLKRYKGPKMGVQTIHFAKFLQKSVRTTAFPHLFLKYKSRSYTNFPDTWKKWGLKWWSICQAWDCSVFYLISEEILFYLKHQGLNKMATVLQITFSNGFEQHKLFIFEIWFNITLLLRFQLTIYHNWFRQWLVPNWWQAIPWTNDDKNFVTILGSLDLNK